MTIHFPSRAALVLAAVCATSGPWAQSNSEVARGLIDKPSDAVPACAVLSTDEVVKITGRRSYVKPEGVQLRSGGSSCTWDSGVNVNLFSGPKSAEQHESLMKAFKADKTPRQAVSGVGDSAFVTFMMLGKYQGDHALMVVRKGAHTIGISLEAKEPETPQSVQPKLMTVAKTAVAKLP